MAKPNRGKNIRKIKGFRGVCPICKRTGVKLLWTKINDDKETIKVCKICGK